MCWYPDAKDGNVDAGDNASGAPFKLVDCAPVLCNNADAIDNNLHE